MTRLDYLQSILTDSLKEKFKLELTIQAITEEIITVAKRNVFEKYKDITITRNDMEFELIGVDASFYSHCYFEKNPVRISLIYTCKSKLPKDKKEKVESTKADYLKTGCIGVCYLKSPLWYEFDVKLSLEETYKGTFNIEIK
jgi:hypothetical protein